MSTQTPKRGGTLRVGTWGEDAGLNPFYNAWDSNGALYGSLLYDTLASITPDATAVPNLAKTITHNSDYTQWTVVPRSGVSFHDGTALTADVIAANWTTLRMAPLTAANYKNIASVKATSSGAVVFTMKTPWVPFDIYLASAWVVHPKMLDPKYKGKPIGTGPFVYQDWVSGSHLNVTRNPNYWQKDLPYLDKVTVTPITNAQQRENALQSGTVDFILVGSDIDDVPKISGDKNVAYLDALAGATSVPSMAKWVLNCAKPPTDDVRIRRALAYATDQSKYNQLYLHGTGSATGTTGPFVPVTGPFAPGSPWFTETGYPKEPNIAKAKQLVQAYAAEHGQPALTVNSLTGPLGLIALQLAQSEWEAVGFKVTVQPLEITRLISDALLGNYQVTYWSAGAATVPDQDYPLWTPTNSAPIGTATLKPDRLKDERVQPLLVTGRTSKDRSERLAAYQRISKIFAQDMPYVYVGRLAKGVATRLNVQNWANGVSPDGAKVLWSSAPITHAWIS